MTDDSDQVAAAAEYSPERMDRLAEHLFMATLGFATSPAEAVGGAAVLNSRESMHAAVKLAAVMTYTTVLAAGPTGEDRDATLADVAAELQALFVSAVTACVKADPDGAAFAEALGLPVIGATEGEA